MNKYNIKKEVIIELEELVQKGEGIKSFELLQKYGFDFWMQKSGISE